MFLLEFVQVVRRRWLIVVTGLVITLAAAVLVSAVSPPTNRVTAEMLLLPPPSSVPSGGNPYLYLGGLNAVVDILAVGMTDSSTASALRDAGVDPDFEIGRDAGSAAPMIALTVSATGEAEALRRARVILDQIPVKLHDLQAKAQVPQASLITTITVVAPKTTQLDRKGQLRSLVMLVAGCLILTALATGWIDYLDRRGRSSGRKAAPAES